jgi:alcohol dehydrogenase (cytochrome c)
MSVSGAPISFSEFFRFLSRKNLLKIAMQSDHSIGLATRRTAGSRAKGPADIMTAMKIAIAVCLSSVAMAQVPNYRPVTEAMLKNPPPGDWLMFSRTYDAQRYSPLKQITKGNVASLRLAWSRGLTAGQTESIPVVHDGVIYTVSPGAVVQAIDGTTGNLLWEYQRKQATNVQRATARTKNLAIYEDVVLYTAPDGFVLGLDAKTGEPKWETYAGVAAHTSGPIVVNGKVISGRACGQSRDSCYITAHDARTGKELWKFYTVPAVGEPGGDTWGEGDHEKHMASTWGLPGSYDPKTNTVLWGIANAMPNTRMARNNGKADAISNIAPSALYSNSTVALDPETGKLKWYYQHLPGDDWDEDYTNERTLVRSKFNPDPKSVKWINPDVKRGEERDMSVMVGEGGGVFAIDRNNGQFLWATPFPYDTPLFLIQDIDGKTGKTHINESLIFSRPGERKTICAFNTRSYWPTAYSPDTNSLYVAYVDNCLDMTVAGPNNRERRVGVARPGSDPAKLAGLAKINIETGEVLRFGEGPIPATGAVLATAGGLIFHGDINRRFRAYDAQTGKQVWEEILGGPISVSTITYEAKGKQYVAVITGDNGANGGLLPQAAGKTVRGHNTLYVFALP